MKLSECSLLVALNISQWTARKYDKKATNDIAVKHGIDSVVGRYNKSLMPFTDMLKNISNQSAVIREAFYTNTLPYTYEGVRLLPSKNYLDFITMMNGHIVNWRGTVGMFISHYIQLVKDAEDNLGPLYNPAEYPSIVDISNKFDINLTMLPVPDASGFYNVLAEDMAKDQAAQYIKTSEATAHKAMQECWQRLYDAVSKFPAKLADTKASLRADHVESMLDHAKDICALLGKLNILNDPNLEAMRNEVDKTLCQYSAELLSADNTTKDLAREKAEDIMRRMSGYMGVTHGN